MVKDPLRAPPGAGNLGSAALNRGASTNWEVADVVEYNSATHTAMVRTLSGRTLQDVPQIKMGPGEYEHFRLGTSVVVTYDLGFPAILGCINFVGRPQTSLPAPTLTGLDGVGDDNPIQSTEGSNSYKPAHAPLDMTNGDWARVGTFGNHVAVMEGGVSLFGSPTAHLRSLGLAGVMQLIAQQLHTYTDFGEWKTTNNGGKTSFTLRAGSNQSTQTGLDEENWTIRVDLGATGDVFNFEVTEPGGRTLFKLHVDPQGRVQIFGDGGVDISSGARAESEAISDVGNRTTNVHGAEVLDVKAARTTNVGGVDTANLSSDRDTVVGGSETQIVEDNQTLSVGGTKTEVVVGGGPTETTPGSPALTTKVLNGGWMIDIGNPLDGANIGLMAAYHLRTALGDITLESGGAMNLSARLPVRINGSYVFLGGTSLTPLDGVVTGRATDTFTGSRQFALGNASRTVWAK
jgi:hypothetical protein